MPSLVSLASNGNHDQGGGDDDVNGDGVDRDLSRPAGQRPVGAELRPYSSAGIAGGACRFGGVNVAGGQGRFPARRRLRGALLATVRPVP